MDLLHPVTSEKVSISNQERSVVLPNDVSHYNEKKGGFPMRRFSVLFMLLLTFVFFFPLVAKTTEKIPEIISIGTHPIGSFFNTIGVAASKVIMDHSKIRAIPKPMLGPTAWFPYMERGEVELGVLNVWDAEKGYLGESVYERLSNKKGFSIRLLCVSIWNSAGIVVAKDSGMQAYSDLKGKRVCGNFPTPSLQLQTEAFLSNGNVTWKEITPVPVSSVVEGVKMLMEGRSDSSGTITLGTPVIEELNAKKGARFLPMDPSPEAVARMRKFHPGYMVKVEPGPGNTGIQKEQYLWAYDIYLIVHEKVSDEAAYLMTKLLWDNCAEFEKVHKLLKDWTPSRFVSRNAMIPYHPGVIKFYKEKGAWGEEMDRLQKSLLEKKK